MSIIIYSTCRIQFIPNNKAIPERNYSDRSTVEIWQSENITDYSLRAIDIENNKAEIFNFPLSDVNEYRFGILDNQPDEIDCLNGTYRLWLSQDSCRAFHDTFHAILEMLFPDEEINTSSSTESLNTSSSFDASEKIQEQIISFSASEKIQEQSISFNASEKIKEQSIPLNPMNCDPKDILTDVRNLSRFIRQGDGDEAARMAKQLVSQGIRLRINPLKQLQNEEEFRILVQLDGNEYSIDQNGPKIPINVFPSTTVRELRATFEAAYHYCPTSQYFFVNGNLAQDDFTMRDLNVGPNSLFILFLIVYPKQFKTNGPWKCSSCTTQNQQDNLKCRICSASRIE